MVSEQRIISVREVFNELKEYEDRLSEWAKINRSFFPLPTLDEMKFVTEIFQVAHFQALIRKKEQLQGKPVADPFVIARAKATKGCVVTQGKMKDHAAKIPNVCKHFDIPCIDLEGFMEKENWMF